MYDSRWLQPRVTGFESKFTLLSLVYKANPPLKAVVELKIAVVAVKTGRMMFVEILFLNPSNVRMDLSAGRF